MYIPKHFREDDIPTLHALMQEHNFAVLVTQQPNGVPLATHLPFILDTERGPYGTLFGHMARANQQWQGFDGMQEVLLIFQGPHAYVSPSWYDAKLSAPTWNFAAVHAYGKPQIIEDETEMYVLLQDQVQTFESHFEKPWTMDLPDEYMHRLMAGIVGFSIQITRLEGKFKLSQNRPTADQIRVAGILKGASDTASIGVAELMEKQRQKR